MPLLFCALQLGFACALLTIVPARAATLIFTWDGSTSNDFNVGSNWDQNLVPGSGGLDIKLLIDGGQPGNVVVSVFSTPIFPVNKDIEISSGDTLAILNGVTLTVDGSIGGSIVNNGTISLGSTGTLTDIKLRDGTFTFSGTGVVTLSNDANNRILANTASDHLINSVGHTIQGSGQIGFNQLTLTNTGTIQANQSQPLTIDLSNSTPFTNQGVLRATNSATLIFTDNLTNAATVFSQNGATFTVLGTFTQSGGSTSIKGGTFKAAATTIQAGLLQGSGTIEGPVSNSGVIAPGDGGVAAGIGTLTFSHSLTLTPTSLLHFELGGTSSFDTIQAQSATLGGGLVVTLVNGFESSISRANTFTLLTTTSASGLTGTFNGLANGARLFLTPGGPSFQVDYFADSFRLSDFQTVPEPSTYAMLVLGGALLFFRSRSSFRNRR